MQSNPFVMPTDWYQRDIDPIKHYVQQMAFGLSKARNITIEKATEFVRKLIGKGGKFEFKDPIVNYLQRKANGDREKKKTTFYRYIKDSIAKKELIAPTLTTYVHPDVETSLLSLYIDEGVASRSAAKKEMFRYKAAGNRFMEALKKTEQSAKKTANNSVSGAHCTPSTPLFNPTAHSTLTSNCRSTAGYGNCNNEKLLMGNRHYWSHSVVINNILSICTITQMQSIQDIVSKYGLHVPSIQEVMQVIRYSTDMYWHSQQHMATIEHLVVCLSDVERCAFVYVGDMYHLRVFNPEFTRTMLTKLSSKAKGVGLDSEAILKNASEEHLNLSHLICRQETKGIGKDYKKTSIENVNTVAATVANIQSVVAEYSDLYAAFYTTKNMPASMAYFPNSVRRCVLTGDTDSTIFTVQDWVLWFKGKISFDDEATSIANTMVYFASATITHLLATMSANFGIVKARLYQIAMKNEYYFPVYGLTNLGKHYIANMAAQEGNVYDKYALEIKGVYLKSSTLPTDIKQAADQMIQDILTDVMTDGKLSARKYIDRVTRIEGQIVNSIRRGEPRYLRAGSIKDAETYTKGEDKSPYQQHHFWNEVFGPKYGMMPKPPYDTLKFSLTLGNKTDTIAWLATIKDEGIRRRMTEWLGRNSKTHLTTLNLPTVILMNKGFPEEIMDIIDYRRIVSDICKIFYILLEMIGVYVQGDKIKRLVGDFYQEYKMDNPTMEMV